MSIEFEKDSFLSLKKLSANSHYYNEVFKRTERVASVVFYVLSYIPATDRSEVHHRHLSDKAMLLHEAAIASLNLHEYEAKDNLHDLMQALVALESTLHVASAARVITPEVDRVITGEIDTVQRMIRNHYLQPDSQTPLGDESLTAQTDTSLTAAADQASKEPARTPRRPARPARSGAPKGDISSQSGVVYGGTPARIDRIKTVLEAKGEASIKDIADVISDCSEKTIQRDLNNLIDAGEVVRHGERRWSRYTITKS